MTIQRFRIVVFQTSDLNPCHKKPDNDERAHLEKTQYHEDFADIQHYGAPVKNQENQAENNARLDVDMRCQLNERIKQHRPIVPIWKITRVLNQPDPCSYNAKRNE